MLNRKSAFLITKPLQLLISFSIYQELDWDEKPLFIIINLFAGAKDVCERFNKTFSNSIDVLFFKSKTEAYIFCKKNKIKNIFIDSDVGVINFITLAILKFSRQKRDVFVYEEGVGTYRNDLYTGMKKYILNKIGAGVYFGGSRMSSKIFLYTPDEYKRNFPFSHEKVVGITNKLVDTLIKNLDVFNYIFCFQPNITPHNNSICYLYLTSWCINDAVIKKLEAGSCDSYLKLHPHLKNIVTRDRVVVLPSQAPAELVIIYLLSVYNMVYIFDHNSSVRRYISCDRVIFNSVD